MKTNERWVVHFSFENPFKDPSNLIIVHYKQDNCKTWHSEPPFSYFIEDEDMKPLINEDNILMPFESLQEALCYKQGIENTVEFLAKKFSKLISGEQK
jgi:hypothetical protein